MLAWIKKRLPTREQLMKSKSLRWMSQWLEKHPYLWKWKKHNVAGGVAVSLLAAFIPLPIQMLTAALLAVLFRVNLPVAVVTTWLTNPVTFIPANYLIYKVGEVVTQNTGNNFVVPEIHMHWDNLRETGRESMLFLASIGKVYLVGLPIFSLCIAIVGYVVVYTAWTLYEIFASYRKRIKNNKRKISEK